MQKAYELYRANFQQMAAAYPQVLITQRTLFQARADYIQALVDLWQNKILIEGLLLTGGLDAPGEQASELEGEPGTGRLLEVHAPGSAEEREE